MTHTPDEIKKGLETCSTKKPCASCPMYDECKEAASLKPLWDNALALIQQLERGIKIIAESNDFKLYRERNIKGDCGAYACDLCKHGGKYEELGENKCPKGCSGISHWEWRGVKEE